MLWPRPRPLRTSLSSLGHALLAVAHFACTTPAPVVAPPPVAAPAPPAPPPPLVPAPAELPDPAPLAVIFHRELEVAVTALAVERPPFAAAVTRDAVWMHEARGWHEEKLPRAAQGGLMAVFYGRDERVRVVGGRDRESGSYLRWEPEGGFRAAPHELGKLAALPRPLVSVLGTADPEIVCQPGDTCLVKRRTGWRFLDAPADLRWVTLGEGVGWAIAGKQLLRLGDRWESVGPPGEWRVADALFATGDRAWVVETTAQRVHTFDGVRWQTVASPVERPRALWGPRGDALWLAGEGGLGFFDGQVWRRVADAPAPFSAVAGRGEGEVWVGGDRGLFRIDPRR